MKALRAIAITIVAVCVSGCATSSHLGKLPPPQAFDKPLKGVNVSWTDLKGPGGAAIGREHVQVDFVGYVKTTTPDYEVEYVGWWPDPLMPIEPFDVPTQHTQPLWLTAYAPPGAPAGVYKGFNGPPALQSASRPHSIYFRMSSQKCFCNQFPFDR